MDVIEQRPRILGPADGLVTGTPGRSTDRFLVDGDETGGRLAVVEHTLGPRVLAAPMHLHTKEDEFSFVLEGRMAAVLGGEVVEAGVGDLVFKPRHQWHTFWNPGDTPTRILELISPAGLEQLFRMLGETVDASTLPDLEAIYGCQVDEEATQVVLERHGLEF